MAENDVKTFKYEEFAKDLSTQASQVIPQDIKSPDREFVVEIIYRFCNMAGDALVKEENSKLNAQEASLITQFIGEWIFHKSIDIIRAGIDPKQRESILQKVAFTVFDIAKRAVEKQIPQEQLITLVEVQVKKCFTKAIEELKEKGLLSEQLAQNTLAQSNIDSMAQQQVEVEVAQEMNSISDDKMIKLASLAVLIRNFPSDKVKKIVAKFDKPEKDVLLEYLKMPNLEEKLDMKSTIKCFKEIKQTLPESVQITPEKVNRKMCKIVKNSDKNKILNIINKERPNVKEYVMSYYGGDNKKISPYIADVISKYLEENAS